MIKDIYPKPVALISQTKFSNAAQHFYVVFIVDLIIPYSNINQPTLSAS